MPEGVDESKQVVMMVMPDGTQWVHAQSLVDYLRRTTVSALEKREEAVDAREPEYAIGCAAVADAVRQIADSLTLTMMEAGEVVTARGKRWR